MISTSFEKQITSFYCEHLLPLLEQAGLSVPETVENNIPIITVTLLLIIIEAFFMQWVHLPIRKNHSIVMWEILRTREFKAFSAQMVNMIESLDEETHWDTKDFIHLDAEVDIIEHNKNYPKTKNLLKALQHSPNKNNISLVIGNPGSGKSVAMRRLCT